MLLPSSTEVESIGGKLNIVRGRGTGVCGVESLELVFLGIGTGNVWADVDGDSGDIGLMTFCNGGGLLDTLSSEGRNMDNFCGRIWVPLNNDFQLGLGGNE